MRPLDINNLRREIKGPSVIPDKKDPNSKLRIDQNIIIKAGVHYTPRG